MAKGSPLKWNSQQEECPSQQSGAILAKKMLVSYADKKSDAKIKTRMVFLLSTMQDEMRVSKDQWAKLQPIVYYDHMNGGVDAVDLTSAMVHECRITTRQWTLSLTCSIHCAQIAILSTTRWTKWKIPASNPKIHLISRGSLVKLWHFLGSERDTKTLIWIAKWRQSENAQCSQDSQNLTCASSLCCKSAHWK